MEIPKLFIAISGTLMQIKLEFFWHHPEILNFFSLTNVWKEIMDMSTLIAYCGLDCETCPIYVATRVEDVTEQVRMRTDIADQCTEIYNVHYTADDITDCDGCSATNGRLFEPCTECMVRNCAATKNIRNCSHCSEYVCELLDEFFMTEPESKERLELLKQANA